MATLENTARIDSTRRQHALADTQFASIIDGDLTPSEDETTEEQALGLETVQSAIGISIGEQQTRLISPKTPAAEKAAALEDLDGGGLFDGFEQHLEAQQGSATPPISSDSETDVDNDVRVKHSVGVVNSVGSGGGNSPIARLPSPWRAGPKTFQNRDHRASLRQQLQGGARRRSSSGGAMSEAVRKYMNFSLPSMPKTYKDLHFSLPSFSALSLDGQSAPSHDRKRRSTLNASSPPPPPPELILNQHTPPPARHSQERPVPRLRRSNSEGSLLVYRSKSFASSLGDDSRFESVQEQVNSRLKAIRDSWQDANFKFPSPTMPNFNFGSRDDVLRNRNPNRSRAFGSIDATATHRTSSRPQSSLANSQGQFITKKTQSASTDGETHLFFTKALQELEGDLVILGGYRGSVLRSAEAPHRQLWVPIKVGLNLRKVDLEVPFDANADERMEETIIPSGMLKHIGPVDMSKRLFKRLRSSDAVQGGKLRVHDYGYDWRLSPHFLSRRMIQFLESLPCNQPDVPREKKGAIILAHSLGGLIVRHAINVRPDLVAGVVYAGVPQRCVNILGPFRKGDDVLFSSRVLTAQVNFSIRTSFALLPLDGKCFINKHTKEDYPIDFFDVNTWKEHRLSPCLGPAFPRPDPPKDSSISVSGMLNAMSQALPTFSVRKYSLSRSSQPNVSISSSSVVEAARGAADVAKNVADKAAEGGAEGAGMGPQMSQGPQSSSEPNPATAVTIPYDKAVEYLTRTLAEVKAFKQELAYRPEHTEANTYPPIALIYGKATPTVFGAKVETKDQIRRTDAYDELAFASGDGVVLARAAMVPEGYSVVRGGVVSSERGHVTLLGDLEAVGRCLHAVMHARRSGVGTGCEGKKEKALRSPDGSRVLGKPVAAYPRTQT